MKKNRRLSVLIALMMLLPALLSPLTALAAGNPEPTYGTATVDGDISEWDLENDFFTDMHRAWKTNKPLESKAYLRYDCATQTMYVLVLGISGVPIITSKDDAWVAIDQISNKVVSGKNNCNGNPPDFSWVGRKYDGNNNHARGFEASFEIEPGDYNIIIHTNVYDDGEEQTSGTPKSGIPITLQASPNIEVIKYFSTDNKVTWQESKTSPGPEIVAGTQVYFKFVVRNTGNVALSNISVTDDKLGLIGSATSLAAGGTLEFVTSSAYTVQAGQHVNTVTAKGKYWSSWKTDTDKVYFKGVAASPSLTLTKYTNDVDANTATGPLLPVGSTVTWKYVVTNNGNVKLTNIAVTDNKEGAIGTIASLDPGASATLTKTGTAAAGQYENTATASCIYNGQNVSASDVSHYFGTAPSISIVKKTNGEVAHDGTGPVVLKDSTVTWTYTVTNNGNVNLTNITVTDNKEGTIGTLTSLAVGASYTFTKTGTATAGQYYNTATVTAKYGSKTVSDTDDSRYFGAAPSIEIVKKTNNLVVSEGTGPVIIAGSTVTWTYTVTNTGNVDLTDITVVDNEEGTIGTRASLSSGATYTFTKTGTAEAGQYTNTATVTAKFGSTTVSDSDDSRYFGAAPSIDIVKKTNGEVAHEGTGPVVQAGSTVTWTYTVTNNGNVDLTNIVVTDDKEGQIGTLTSLAPGASHTFTKSGNAITGQYINTATVTADYGDMPVTDSDDSRYFGADPKIAIVKKTNGEVARTATGPKVLAGSTVTWTYTITNAGNVDLTNIEVVDDMEGDIGTLDVLAPGESFTFTKEGTAVAGQYVNIATVTAVYGEEPVQQAMTLFRGNSPNSVVVGGTTVSSTDVSNYLGVTPAIEIVKKTNGILVTDAMGPEIPVGGAVTWTYTVTNTGDVDLTDIVVVDDIEGFIGTLEELAAGASHTFTKEGTAALGQYANTATVTAMFDTHPVSDTSGSSYFGYEAGIQIKKYVSVDNQVTWLDADEEPYPEVTVGEDVYFKIVVTCTGNVVFDEVIISDSMLDENLAVTGFSSESYAEFIFPVQAVEGVVINTATATTEYNGTVYTDTDTAGYEGIEEITIIDTPPPGDPQLPETGEMPVMVYVLASIILVASGTMMLILVGRKSKRSRAM